MTGQTDLVPKRRFQEFLNSHDWEQRKLGELAEFNPKSMLPDKFEYVDLESVVGTDLITHRTESKESAPSRAQRLAQRGDVFYQTVRPYQKNNYLYDLPYDNYVFSTGYAQMRPSIDSYFLLSRVQEELFVKAVLDRSTGTSYPAINSNDLAELEIKVPIYGEEQVKIGSLFRSLDHLITLHQRKLEKTKALKAAYLSEMFPAEGESEPKRRFAGFTGAWEQRELGEVADIVRGASPRPIQDPKWFDDKSDVGWLRISDVTEQEGRIRYLEQRISKAGQEKTRVLTEPHLLLSIAATVGKPVVNYVKTGVHDGFLIFQNPKFDREFMFQWLEMFRPQWQQYGQPGSQVNLNSNLVKDQEVMLPDGEEQKKIGDFFANLDTLITLHQRKLEKLQNLKKAYLNEMYV
ncbi:restriction endonuclease subunit S [Paenibacillus crassostreae]|nr:restriction endonuclease subunit S [Paenibacillus crassostreae]